MSEIKEIEKQVFELLIALPSDKAKEILNKIYRSIDLNSVVVSTEINTWGVANQQSIIDTGRSLELGN